MPEDKVAELEEASAVVVKLGLDKLEKPLVLEFVNKVLGWSWEFGWGTVLISLPGEAKSIKGGAFWSIGEEARSLAVLPDCLFSSKLA